MLKTDAVNEVLDRLVAESGDTAFESNGNGCYYRNSDGSPQCIVGHVLYRLEPEVFAKINTDHTSCTPNSTVIDALTHEGAQEFLVSAEEDARSLLNEAQYYQDRGYTWAEAVEKARAALARRKAGH